MPDGANTAIEPSGGFRIFRRDDAPLKTKASKQGGLTDVSRAGLAMLAEAGLGDGAESRLVFEAPGFSLIHVWFKSGFPLYRHSHGPDCLYEVIAGSLQIGEEVLRKGDGFFLPAGTPYTFAVGDEGVEVLEFRNEPLRDSVVHANNPAFWEKAAETITAHRERWATEARPQ